jgi:hypothetical protein
VTASDAWHSRTEMLFVERVTRRLVAWPAIGTSKLAESLMQHLILATVAGHPKQSARLCCHCAMAVEGPAWVLFELCTHMTSCLASRVANVSLVQQVAQV